MTDSQEEDFLEVDPQVRGQNYCCISFVSPENILADKAVWKMHKFLANMQKRYKKVRREQMIIPGKFKAAKVINGNIEAALKFFKRQVKESNVLQELKDRKEFIKPSAVKRKQKMDAIRAEYIRRIRSND